MVTLGVPGDFNKSGFNSGVRFQHLAEEGKGEYIGGRVAEADAIDNLIKKKR